jgi:L-ribulokinase
MAKSSAKRLAIGIDYGTNSVRTLIVDVSDGTEVATYVYDYKSGDQGVLLDPKDPNLARQNPADYVEGLYRPVPRALEAWKNHPGFRAEDVVGIGVDTTGSTPIPVDQAGRPLAIQPRFRDNLAAQAWLWKDHTAHAEAAEITEEVPEASSDEAAKAESEESAEAEEEEKQSDQAEQEKEAA